MTASQNRKNPAGIRKKKHQGSSFGGALVFFHSWQRKHGQTGGVFTAAEYEEKYQQAADFFVCGKR
jgi:hypothetical protein